MKKAELRTVGDDGRHRGRGRRMGQALDWSVLLSGEVHQPSRLSLTELWQLPVSAQEHDITCVSSGKIYRPKGEGARFAGIHLRDIAEYVGLKRDRWGQPLARSVRFRSKAPGACGPLDALHETSLPIEACLDPDAGVLLAGILNDLPLPYRNGGPLRSVIASHYFYKSVKWLGHIEFSSRRLEELRGTWERYAGYNNSGLLGGPRFDAFFQRLDAEGSPELTLYGESPELKAQMAEEFRGALASGDISRVQVARLQEFVPDFADDPRWSRALRWSSDASEAEGPRHKAGLRGTRLNKLDLRGWPMSFANFSLCTFIGARLANPDGSEAASLRGCDLEGACFWGAQLAGVDMRDAYLGGVQFAKAEGHQGAEVEGLQLQGARGLDEATAAWLTQRGALDAHATATHALGDDGDLMPYLKLSLHLPLDHPRPSAQWLRSAIQAAGIDECPMSEPSQGFELWIPIHHRELLHQQLLPSLQRELRRAVLVASPQPEWLYTLFD